MRLEEDSDFKRITGKVAANKRQAIINEFNRKGSKYKVIVISSWLNRPALTTATISCIPCSLFTVYPAVPQARCGSTLLGCQDKNLINVISKKNLIKNTSNLRFGQIKSKKVIKIKYNQGLIIK